MRARLAASTLALVILVTGAIPAVARYRCIAMGTSMQAPAPCCHHESDGAQLKAPCCESYAAAQLEPRRTPAAPDTLLQAPLAVGAVVFPALAPSAASVEPRAAARARGRPPGDQLHLLSSVQRV